MNKEKYPEATVIGIGLLVVTIVAAIIANNSDFTEDSYNQFRAISSIIFLILRIAIIIWIINIAKYLNRVQFGWGIFAFFLPSIALIVIGQIKKKKVKPFLDNNEIISYKSNETNLINDNIEIFQKQKNILDDLKTNGVLSETEYKEKLNLMLKQEESDNKQKTNEQIQKIVNERIKPYLNKLSELTKANILTKEEFEKKKEELIHNYTKKVQDEISRVNNDEVNVFEKISKYDLTGVEIMGVTRLETQLTKGELILKSKETKIINIHSKVDINNIIANGETDKYFLIELQK